MASTCDNNAEIKESESPMAPSMTEKYGHINVVSASFHVLISFVLRKLGFLSIQDDKKYDTIVSWSNEQIKSVISLREKIKDLILDITNNYPSSSTAIVMGCKMRFSEKGESYCYSHWYSSKNSVPDHIIQENNISLKEAKLSYLLNQVCFRLQRLLQKIKKLSNCDTDFAVGDMIQNEYKIINAIKNQVPDIISDKMELRIARTPNVKASKAIPNAPKKSAPTTKITGTHLKPRKLDFDSGAEKNSYAKVVKDSKKKSTHIKTDSPVPVNDPNEDLSLVKESDPKLKLIDITDLVKKYPEINTKKNICPHFSKQLLQESKDIKSKNKSTLIDLDKESPSGSEELFPTEVKNEFIANPEEMIQIQILTFKDDKPIISPIIMNKKDYNKIPVLTSPKME